MQTTGSESTLALSPSATRLPSQWKEISHDYACVFIYIQIHISLRKIFVFCFKTLLQSVELWTVMGPGAQHGASSGVTWGLEGGGSESFILITLSLFLKTPFIENTTAQIINLHVVSTIIEAIETVKQEGRVSDRPPGCPPCLA